MALGAGSLWGCVHIYVCILIYIYTPLGLAAGPHARRPQSHYHLEIG